MKSLLILTAVDLEARGLARHLGLSPVSSSSFPHYRHGPIELACVGLRASGLEGHGAAFRDAAVVISAGACGALAPELQEGALVVPEAIVDETGARVAAAPLRGIDARGTLVTVTRALASAAEKARLWLETGAIACDMESMAIVRWAQARGTAAVVVRGVSDTADHGVPADLAAVVSDDGRVRTIAAVRAALSRRGAIKDAFALRRGTSAALYSVATALAKVARA